jgi:hypothetical protein
MLARNWLCWIGCGNIEGVLAFQLLDLRRQPIKVRPESESWIRTDSSREIAFSLSGQYTSSGMAL